ncbi:hypothetical protein CPB83DRAFT_831473 [Crepidotus variabilis]|uniref:Uncharacterized protein n=1 Tax=Crepidotus variabilis TaxID=179855 RepID=A0A9P6ESU5_9AGAR|nr:hypothetical protein CPB83DRAFT_831473 [Crepidotus variabilis]
MLEASSIAVVLKESRIASLVSEEVLRLEVGPPSFARNQEVKAPKEDVANEPAALYSGATIREEYWMPGALLMATQELEDEAQLCATVIHGQSPSLRATISTTVPIKLANGIEKTLDDRPGFEKLESDQFVLSMSYSNDYCGGNLNQWNRGRRDVKIALWQCHAIGRDKDNPANILGGERESELSGVRGFDSTRALVFFWVFV